MLKRFTFKQDDKPESAEMEAAKECFFCGAYNHPDGEDVIFMTVVTKDGRIGAWPSHEACLQAAKHPDAGDLRQAAQP
jgi:hypothetical protein